MQVSLSCIHTHRGIDDKSAQGVGDLINNKFGMLGGPPDAHDLNEASPDAPEPEVLIRGLGRCEATATLGSAVGGLQAAWDDACLCV